MNCKQAKKLLKYNSYSAAGSRYKLEAHAQFCIACSQELAFTKLTDTLVNAHIDSTQDDEFPWDNTRLVNRIKLRIQEINERGAASWDTAIIAVRGWLIAFGATAILLLALSTEMATNAPVNQVTSNNVSRNSVNWSEELVSSNSSLSLLPEEDSENAH